MKGVDPTSQNRLKVRDANDVGNTQQVRLALLPVEPTETDATSMPTYVEKIGTTRTMLKNN